MHGTPLSVGSPQEVIEKTLTFQEGFGDYQRQLWVVDALGLPLEMALEQVELLGTEVVPVLRKEMAVAPRARACRTRRRTRASSRAKYGDAEPRQPRPNPNRGDNLTGTSPYQDSDPALVADLPLVGVSDGEPHPHRERGVGGAVPRPGDGRARAHRRRHVGRAAARASTACSTRSRRRPDGLRITELGDDVLLTQAGMSRLVARLEAARPRRARGRPRRRARLPHPPHRGRRRAPSAASASRHGQSRRADHDPHPHRRAARAAARAAAAPAANPRPSTRKRPTTDVRRAKRLVVISAGTGNPSSTRQLADRIAQKSARPARATPERRDRQRDRARAARRRHRPRRRRRLPRRGAPGGDRARSPPPTPSSPPRRSTRPASAACSRRSSTCSTTTCSSPSPSCSRPPAARRATRWSSTTSCARCSPSCARCPCRRRCYAAPEDWGVSALGDRIERAATELAVLVRSGVGAADRRQRLVGLPAPVRRQRHPGRAHRGRRRLQLRADAARGRRSADRRSSNEGGDRGASG